MVFEALTDTQLTAAVQRIARPVEGLDRRSAPVAASQLLGWAIAAATTATPDRPLEVALTHALHDHTGEPDIAVVELPDANPARTSDQHRRRPGTVPTTRTPRDQRARSSASTRQPKLEGGSDAP